MHQKTKFQFSMISCGIVGHRISGSVLQDRPCQLYLIIKKIIKIWK